MRKNTNGFTIIELLIVIVIIAILAAISLLAYRGIQEKAIESKIISDFTSIEQAVSAARVKYDEPIHSIVSRYGNTYQSGGGGGETAACINNHPVGTDYAKLPKSDNCWMAYNATLNALSQASGVDIRGMVDPWGRPYSFETRERPTTCAQDKVWVFSNPTNGWGGRYKNFSRTFPLSNGKTSC